MITFRLAEAKDIPALKEVIARSVRGLQLAFYSSDQSEGALLSGIFAVDSQLICDRTYFLAERDGKVVGCGGWSRRKTLFGGDKAKGNLPDEPLDPAKDPARIRAFFVDPDFARRGIGSEITRRCESAIVAAGFSRAFIVATLPGEKLYARFGYSIARRTTLPLPDGNRLPVVEMEKNFPSNE